MWVVFFYCSDDEATKLDLLSSVAVSADDLYTSNKQKKAKKISWQLILLFCIYVFCTMHPYAQGFTCKYACVCARVRP